MRVRLFLPIAFAACLFSLIATTVAVTPEQFLADWVPEGGLSRADTAVDSVRIDQYTVAKPIAEVYAFYAKKLGIKTEFAAAGTEGSGNSTPNGEISTILVANKEENGPVRSFIFTRRDKNALLTIHLSGLEAGKATLVGLVVDVKR